METDPFAPKPNAHQKAIAKLVAQYPELEGYALYSRYLDICPAYITQETFECYLSDSEHYEPISEH